MDSVLDPVVVDRQFAVVEVTRQRRPAAQVVEDRLGSRGALRHLGEFALVPDLQRLS